MPTNSFRKIRTASLLMALALPFAALADVPKHISPSDVFELRTVADPQISPDGKQVAYIVNFADIRTDTRFSNLWLVNFDGTGNRPITSGNYHDTTPRWSPDGSRLAFISDRDGSTQIYQRWMDSGQTARMTNLPDAPSGITWSPDGHSLAFFSLVEEAPRKLGNLPSPPAGAKWADRAKVIDKLIYRFDQVGYLKPGYSQVFVVSSEGRTPRQISTGKFNHGGAGLGGGAAISWAPDSKSFVLSANRNQDSEYDPLNTDVHEFSVADGTMKTLTSRKGPDNAPIISPDGTRIAYLGFDDRHQGYQVTHLYVMFRDGSNSRQIAQELDRDVTSPHWAPDGRGVYFLYADQGDTKLGYAPLDGKVRTIAAHMGSGLSSYGGGDAISIAKNGRFAITFNSTADPGDVGVGTLEGAGLTKVTRVNQDLLAQRRVGAVEEIWWESSKDKRKLQGWIIKPPDFNPAKKYPLILEIHGGPFANYGDRFDFEKQVFAARGYVVFYSNPRGSTSYGGEFGNLIHLSYPGDDFFDLNSGVDAVIAKGYVDPSNLFVTGGSGGGVLTCWMVGNTTRFKAAASLYPVINWYSWIGTADIGPRMSKYWFAGAPWDNAENLANYEKRSLLSVVNKVTTPTMVMTGEEDYRTPISEAEQYYAALKMNKIDAVLVRIPGEPHGLSRRPSHHLAKVSYIFDWFDQHHVGDRAH
ncbi:MAG: S9 family peptidase [Bryobacteraceae bacterium]